MNVILDNPLTSALIAIAAMILISKLKDKFDKEEDDITNNK
jgi:hypothetical protein